jgi:hypothetical protein
VRALAAAVGRPALLRGLPLYLGLAAPAGVIFGPNGMHPADLASAADASVGVRVALWSAWVLAALPVAHALFDAERTAYLRWLPAPRTWTWTALAAMLLCVHAAFGLFWCVARGPLAATGAMSLAAAVHATLLIAPRHRGEAVARALALGGVAAVIATGLGSGIWLAAGLAGLTVAVPAAWTRCVEHGPRRARALRTRQPSLVLAQLYLRGLWRTRPGLVTRTLLTTALGAGLVVLSSAANQLDLAARTQFSAMVAAVSLSLGVGGLGAPVVEAERGLAWILDSAGAPTRVRVWARSLAAGVAGAALGLVHGVLAGWGAGAGDGLGDGLGAGLGAGSGDGPGSLAGGVIAVGRLAGTSVLLGVGLAIAAVRTAVWAEAAARDKVARRRRAETPELSEGVELDGGRVIAGVFGAMIVAMLALHFFGEAGALLVACAGLILIGGPMQGRRGGKR